MYIYVFDQLRFFITTKWLAHIFHIRKIHSTMCIVRNKDNPSRGKVQAPTDRNTHVDKLSKLRWHAREKYIRLLASLASSQEPIHSDRLSTPGSGQTS